jgi:phosphoribosylanthranilate isomerase
LGPDNVSEAIRQVRPWGVDACSRLERAPGVKDYEKMRRFIKAAMEQL